MTIRSRHDDTPVTPAGGDCPAISVITLVNNDRSYARMKASLRGESESGGVQWIPIDADGEGLNAAAGLNRGIEKAIADWVVCAHQDIEFAAGWWARVQDQITEWERRTARRPAVIGLVAVNERGSFRGSISDPAGFGKWGPLPDRVLCVDEHVIVIRRDSRMRFDADTPGFHCYGADLALEARRRGLDVIAVDAPVTHFSTGVIDDSFDRCAAWLLTKWGSTLGGVIPTCAVTIATGSPLTAPKRMICYVNRRLSVYRRRFGLPLDPFSPFGRTGTVDRRRAA